VKYVLDIKTSAKKGVFEAFDYYESKRKGLGLRFLDDWETHVDIINQDPLLFQKKHKNFRQALIKPYPYHIIYEVEGNLISIYKVIYAGRSSFIRYNKK
jgi:toxin ParE1/3/4